MAGAGAHALAEALERWQKKMTVFSQLEHPGVQGGHYGVHAFLSACGENRRLGLPMAVCRLINLSKKS